MKKMSANCIYRWAILCLVPISLTIATPAYTASLSDSTILQDPVPIELAQTPIGYCTVSDPTGTPLNVRQSPGGRVIGTLKNGTVVALGATDGSEGEKWTRIIQPREGYVWSAYLTDCKY